jgi:hypothetical protein
MIRLIGVLAAAGVFLAVGVSHAAPQGQPPFARGKLTRTVDGVRFSLYVPKTGWENGPHEKIGASKFRTHGLLVSKSTLRGQAAEAVIFWGATLASSSPGPTTRLRQLGCVLAWDGRAGDSIRVWIVDVSGKRLFFEAVTKPGHGVEQEIGDIIRSIRFG